MAMNFTRSTNPNDNLPELVANINNGDLKAIDDVVRQWHFINEASMLRFALAIMLSAKDNKLYADGPDGKKVTLTPTPNLLVQHPTEQPENAPNGNQQQPNNQ